MLDFHRSGHIRCTCISIQTFMVPQFLPELAVGVKRKDCDFSLALCTSAGTDGK